MTPTLVHRVCGVGVERDKILAQFFEDLRKANGKRRSDPEKFVKVVKVRGCAVFYRVPSRVLRGIHQTP